MVCRVSNGQSFAQAEERYFDKKLDEYQSGMEEPTCKCGEELDHEENGDFLYCHECDICKTCNGGYFNKNINERVETDCEDCGGYGYNEKERS